MCELLGLSARLPTRLTFSLEVFAAHGGATDHHRDGWGMAFFEEGDARLFREPHPAAASPLVRFLERCGPASTLVVSHIRRATAGRVRLADTHPFARELGGRLHVFAHNGRLDGIARRLPLTGRFRPIGATDSEHAFCALLERLAPVWAAGAPEVEARTAAVTAFARTLRALGPANFLYADGELLFVHGHRRRQHDGRLAPPGLWLLERRCVEPSARTEGAGVGIHGESQELVLAASVPLSDEPWRPLAEGELVVLRGGRVLARRGGAGTEREDP